MFQLASYKQSTNYITTLNYCNCTVTLFISFHHCLRSSNWSTTEPPCRFAVGMVDRQAVAKGAAHPLRSPLGFSKDVAFVRGAGSFWVMFPNSHWNHMLNSSYIRLRNKRWIEKSGLVFKEKGQEKTKHMSYVHLFWYILICCNFKKHLQAPVIIVSYIEAWTNMSLRGSKSSTRTGGSTTGNILRYFGALATRNKVMSG